VKISANIKEESMASLEQTQETTLSDNGIYEVIESSEQFKPEIVGLKEELAAERDRGLRMLAEFDNYRRRTRQEYALAEQDGKREVLLALLEVMDDFDRALLHLRERTNEVADGVRLIHQRFQNVLHSNGVTSFDSEGKQFDPNLHESIALIDGDGEESGTVFAEDRRGYLINGELLRAASVVVLK
jgi:molecular chaperone GrpE